MFQLSTYPIRNILGVFVILCIFTEIYEGVGYRFISYSYVYFIYYTCLVKVQIKIKIMESLEIDYEGTLSKKARRCHASRSRMHRRHATWQKLTSPVATSTEEVTPLLLS